MGSGFQRQGRVANQTASVASHTEGSATVITEPTTDSADTPNSSASMRLAITAALPHLRRALAMASACHLQDVHDQLYLAQCRVQAAADAVGDARAVSCQTAWR